MNIKKMVVGGLLLIGSAYLQADDKAITINSSAGFYDEKIIPSNIRAECSSLGKNFSISTMKALEKNGWSVKLSDNLEESKDGMQLKLSISNALSSGNAFLGHSKSVAIIAELYKDGELVDTYQHTRNSRGGIGAGFKNSCAVLDRCVETLGKDVSKWLSSKSI